MVNFRGRSKPHSVSALADLRADVVLTNLLLQRTPADGQWLHDKAPTGRSRDVSPKGSIGSSPGSRLVVAGLHYEITPKDLNVRASLVWFSSNIDLTTAQAIFGQIGTLISEPFIRYDRSGRSTGVAIVTYETTEEASKALKQFNGLLAKGQPMEISFDTSAPRPSRKSTTTALLNRIQKQPLLSRLAADSEDAEMSSKILIREELVLCAHAVGGLGEVPKVADVGRENGEEAPDSRRFGQRARSFHGRYSTATDNLRHGESWRGCRPTQDIDMA
ncbi:THO complex [Salix suchowensis]|nr:THO complex [Salix suchowensis]